MNPRLETLGVTVLSAAGVWLGGWFSRQRPPWWALGYLIPLAFVVCVGLTRWNAAFEFVPPISFLVAGRREFVLTGAMIGLLFGTVVPRLPRARDRVVVYALTGIAIATQGIWPFLAPAFRQAKFAALQTHFDAAGVCLQTTQVTCGPAAAVTALRQYGVTAEEGELALAARTSDYWGTPADLLADAVNERFGARGIGAEYRAFRSADELKSAGLTLAVVKLTWLIDHWVTVFEVTPERVVVGDPLEGRVEWTRAEFERRWRHCGVVIRQEPR